MTPLYCTKELTKCYMVSERKTTWLTHLHGNIPRHVDVAFKLIHPHFCNSEGVSSHVRRQIDPPCRVYGHALCGRCEHKAGPRHCRHTATPGFKHYKYKYQRIWEYKKCHNTDAHARNARTQPIRLDTKGCTDVAAKYWCTRCSCLLEVSSTEIMFEEVYFHKKDVSDKPISHVALKKTSLLTQIVFSLLSYEPSFFFIVLFSVKILICIIFNTPILFWFHCHT